jgi:hypothetical protein
MMVLVLVVVVPQLRLVVRPVMQTLRLTIGQLLQVGCRGAVVPMHLAVTPVQLAVSR